MNHTQSLPEPSAEALAHSQKLIDVIREEIALSQGAISFRRYMEMALYQADLGYYVAGTHKIGQQGDFTTAPEISSLFSQCIANQCAEILEYLRNANNTHTNSDSKNKKGQKGGGCLPITYQNSILELGAGSGAMAIGILLELEQQNQLPECYYILDLSPDLIQRQQLNFQQQAPHLLNKVEWISTLPEKFVGVILGNEVLDAMPIDVFTKHNDEVYEHHVIFENGKLTEQLKPANDTLKQSVTSLNIQNDTPYTSEQNPNIKPWLQTLSESLEQGVILLIDYGYTRNEYYLPERSKGTLICHYQHLVNDAPLVYPGLQDITANVDFTAVAEGADEAGLHVAGFLPQAHFLANAGLEKFFMQGLNNQADNQYALAQQVRTLSMPSEMGERFKCIALTKQYDDVLIGFKDFDQRFRL